MQLTERKSPDQPQVQETAKESEEDKGFLRFVGYYIHHGCNLDCPYCKVKTRTIAPMNQKDRQEAFKRLRSLFSSDPNELQIMSFLGGEPTLRPDLLVEAISDAADAGFFVTLTTNGYRLDERLVEKLAALSIKEGRNGGIGQINISADCGTSEKDNLPRALELLKFARSFGIIPAINTVFTRETDVKNFKKFINSIISQDIFVQFLTCSEGVDEGSFSNADQSSVPTKEQLRQLVPWLAYKKYTNGRIMASFGYLWTLFKYSLSGEDNTSVWHCSPHFRNGGNNNGRGFIAMDSDGSVGPCQEFPRKVNILGVPPEELSLRFLDQEFGDTVQKCPGCTFSCYANEETVRGRLKELMELPTALHMGADITGATETVRAFHRNWYPLKDLSQILPRKK